jgi:hypothetical protein
VKLALWLAIERVSSGEPDKTGIQKKGWVKFPKPDGSLKLDNREAGAISASGPGCVKTSTSGERAELFSLFAFLDGARQRCSFLIQLIRGKRSTRKSDFGVFTQPGSISTKSGPSAYVRFTLGSDQIADILERQLRARSGHGTADFRVTIAVS